MRVISVITWKKDSSKGKRATTSKEVRARKQNVETISPIKAKFQKLFRIKLYEKIIGTPHIHTLAQTTKTSFLFLRPLVKMIETTPKIKLTIKNRFRSTAREIPSKTDKKHAVKRATSLPSKIVSKIAENGTNRG